ncbi:hypothetical protein P4O66_020138, partial [Electrophorus voltai]
HPTSGVITLTGKLDYLDVPWYDIDVLAVDRGIKHHGSGGVSSTAKLTVQVLQANVHSPVVTAILLTPWNTTQDPSYAFLTVEDDDEGENGEIASLDIVAGDPFQQFKAIRVSPQMKEYKIKAIKEVAWEGYNFGYNLTLHAKDKGNPPRFSSAVTVKVKPPHDILESLKFEKSIYRVTIKIKVLDVNDNSPEFLQNEYSVDVREDSVVGTDVIELEAIDKDLGTNGKVRYCFLTKTDTFIINEETGIVTLQSPLDREATPSFALKVAAYDKATEEPQLISSVILNIMLADVNDNAPTFSPLSYHVRVREDIPVGTLILWLEAHDPDLGQSGQVRYSLTSDADGSFYVDKVSGAVYLFQTLDFERKQVYNLTAEARDRGKPISLSSTCFIEVEIVDVNENLHRPSFPFFVACGNVTEDARLGASVTKVTAYDEDEGRDGEVSYAIHDGSGLGVFTIDEMSGVIRTQELLDHETTAHYWLIVYATDKAVVPLSSSVEVYVEVQDVNDNAPETSEPVYYSSVPENSPKDVSIIWIQAFDPDSKSSDKLTYEITGGNLQGFFTINSQTGLLTTTSQKLDREEQEEHTLELTDPRTSKLTRLSSKQVTISDNGSPAMSTAVHVVVKVQDENDNAPQFLEKVYKIKVVERAEAIEREPIYRIIARDRDESPHSEISYTIEEGEESRKFFIEPQSGLVSSKEAFSVGEYHILTIKALDSGHPQKSSSCHLHIEWIAKPELPKEELMFEDISLQFSVMESDPVGHMVGVISTQPLDSPVWFDIKGDAYDKEAFHIVQMACDLNCRPEGGNGGRWYTLEKGSGTIIIAKPLDAEQRSYYNLTVEATDGTRSISTQVLIKVIDTNEHQPQFAQAKYEINIPEETQPGTKILKISATDKDDKKKLSYKLLSSTDPHSLKNFRLDPWTGFLYTAEELDHETMHRHILTVMVRDQHVPVKRNLVRVIIHVEDRNDNAPWFTSSQYSGQVFESAAIGSAVLQVTALDKDKGQNAEILYSIESGDDSNSFEIDMILGIIKVAEELGCTNRSQYELKVKASDKGDPPLSVFTTIYITVTISNNAEPKFNPSPISVEISEAAPVGTFVTIVAASSQSSVLYQIKEGNTNGTFDINPNSGSIVTRRKLDYETLSSYKLTVQGTNMAGMSSDVMLLVFVKDVNDNAPVFTQTEFMGYISEAATPRTVVLTNEDAPLVIHATDADEKANARLVYQIVEPFARNYFAIDSGAGVIQTISSLDYEYRRVFHFTVHAHDAGVPCLFTQSVASVTVYVIDVNDCNPRFSQDFFETTLLLPTYKGVRVITLNATDDDSLPNAKLLFSILDGNTGNKFKIDPILGEIFVQNATQLHSRYILTVRVSDGKFTSTAMAKITVQENKAHGLKFTQEIFTASIQENSSERETLAIIAAVGNKIDEPLLYSILNPDRRFDIGHTSGVLFTTGIPFDREEQDTFDVIVEVTKEKNGVGTAHVLVKVTVEDVNDNAPLFVNLPYTIVAQMDAIVGTVFRQLELAEDLPVGTELYVIQSKSKDPMLYRLIRGNIPESNRDDAFVIETNTGKLKLTKRLDYETTKWYQLSVQVQGTAEHMELTSVIDINIQLKDVNDNNPQFDSCTYKSFIVENLPGGTSVVQVRAMDLDSGVNGQVVYSLAENQENPEILELFAVDSRTGWVTTVSEIDREKKDMYTIMVIATDRAPELQMTGTTIVEVAVVDVNDNPPVFTEAVYKAAVREDESAPGTVITTLSITDNDSEEINRRFSCFITSKEPQGLFLVGYVYSACTVMAGKTLDREDREHYVLNITATDGTYMAKTTVDLTVLDANDNDPVCEKGLYAVKVPENSPAGKLILRVSASDPDIKSNAEIIYRLTGGGDDSFRIDSATGTLETLLPLDREKRDVYNVTVQALDGENRFCQADVLITVEDINDNAPIFTSDMYHVNVLENTQPGACLARLQASDADTGLNSKISYSFEYSAGGLFSIEEQSGIISLVKPLNRPKKASYRLRVCAVDHGAPRRLSSLCSVEVAVVGANNHPPLFEQRDYVSTVPEDIAVGTQLLTVFAAGRDVQSNGQTWYSITAGNEKGAFRINSQTGDIFVIARLDYEASRQHYLTVKATSGGEEALSDTATVTIHLTDVNDNCPVFSQEVYSAAVQEDSEAGCSVLTVSASDFDGPSNNRLRFSIAAGYEGSPFIIDTVSGVVKVAHQLDREKVAGYKLTVLASDSGNPPKSSTAAINITVADVNDNSPIFSQVNYSLVIQESLHSGASVLQLSVTDNDSPENGPPFSYNIFKGNEGKLFSIDHQGVVRTTASLKSIGKNEYAVYVQVSDSGQPPLQSSALLNIHIAQASVYPPCVFPQEIFILVLGEEFPGGFIGKVHATDPDEYDTLTYSFEPPLNNLFSVSGADGHLLAYGGLDVGYYLLNISVSDGRFSASAGVTVHVRRITQRMLDRSVSVRFAGINATHFIRDHWRNIQRVLCGIAGTRVAGVQILSLQPVEANDLDVLMSLEGSGSSHSFLELLLHKLNTSSTVPARLSSLRVVSVTPRWCTDTERLGRVCGRVVTLDPSSMVVSGTSRVSYVTPHYRVTPRCICKGGSLMRFSEKSYIKYHWRRNTTEVIKFSLRFKTLSSHGTVMIVKGRGYSILEVAEGRLQCHLDCGSGLATMPVHRTAVNDGHWHTVEMEVKRSHARLVLDHLHSASSILSGAYPCLGLDVQVILGRHTGLLGSRPRRTLSVSSSLQGCMDLVRLNEHSLLLRSEALSGIALDDMAEVMPGCDMNSTPDTDCSSNPCLNGGHCSQRRSGGYYCMCNNLFMGVHCEFSMSPCASNPCLYGGVCIQNNNEYYCRCRGQYTGQRCEIGPYCKENPCMNGGHCIDSLDGPVCECKAGFKGERCLADMDECLQLPCLNGGWCTNTHGSFNCSCQPGFSGRLCEMHGEGHDIFISSSWNVDLAEPAVILFLAIFFLAVLNILVCHTYCKSSKEEQEREIHRAAEAYTQRAYLDNRPGRKTFLGTPPPVPLKPVSYTPSASGDPSKAMDSGSMPEFSSLTPDVRLGPRKMVAVCSGSPSLPQCRDSCLPTDSESVQKSDMDEDDNGRTVLVQAR